MKYPTGFILALGLLFAGCMPLSLEQASKDATPFLGEEKLIFASRGAELEVEPDEQLSGIFGPMYCDGIAYASHQTLVVKISECLKQYSSNIKLDNKVLTIPAQKVYFSASVPFRPYFVLYGKTNAYNLRFRGSEGSNDLKTTKQLCISLGLDGCEQKLTDYFWD